MNNRKKMKTNTTHTEGWEEAVKKDFLYFGIEISPTNQGATFEKIDDWWIKRMRQLRQEANEEGLHKGYEEEAIGCLLLFLALLIGIIWVIIKMIWTIF